jgi:radical SAM superfamily enzyme YgiQ (UPF0313 family)
MDILLTHGYFLEEDENERRIMKPYPPLGILYISAYLKAKGFSVEVFDTTFSTKEKFFRYVEQQRPSLVGIYCNLMTKINVLSMLQFLKQNDSASGIILGGPEPPAYAEQFIKHGADVVVVGEGEEATAELIPHLQKHGARAMHHIAGIVYREENGEIVQTPPRPLINDLNTLPLPDRCAINIEQYINVWRKYHHQGSVSLITARGCPYTCTWCSHSVFGETHRRRSPQLVAEEIELIRDTYHPDMLWYADDVFTIHHRWLFEFESEMKRRNLKIPFECITRADRMNEQVVQTLKALGCFRVWIGSESGSQHILNAMQRGVTVEQVQAMTKLAQHCGIQVGMFIMLGFDGETEEDIEATIDHLKKANPDVFLTTVAYPIKGTPFYDTVESRLVEPRPWELRTERQLSFGGRYSKRFYWFATRRLVNEVNLYKLQFRKRNKKKIVQKATMFAKVQVARIGMKLTR